jgi:hypothetical protein
MESSILVQLIWVYLNEADRKEVFPRWLLKFARYRAAGLAALAARHVVASGLPRSEWEARARSAIPEVLAHWRWQRRRFGADALLRMKGLQWRATLPAGHFRECWPFNAPAD